MPEVLTHADYESKLHVCCLFLNVTLQHDQQGNTDVHVRLHMHPAHAYTLTTTNIIQGPWWK